MTENQNPNPQPQQPPAPDPQPPQPPAAPPPQNQPQVMGNNALAQPTVPTNAPLPGSDQILPSPAGLYGSNGLLTHHGMHQQIRSGGSVMHNGRVIVRAADLPSAAELAQRDTEHAQGMLDDARSRKDFTGVARAQRLLNEANTGSQQTTADIDRQIAALQQQRSTIAAQPDKSKK